MLTQNVALDYKYKNNILNEREKKTMHSCTQLHRAAMKGKKTVHSCTQMHRATMQLCAAEYSYAQFFSLLSIFIYLKATHYNINMISTFI